MKKIKQQLTDFNKEISKHFDFLSLIGYMQKEMVFKRLDTLGNFIPDMPYLESTWKNESVGREIIFTVYINYITFCHIVDTHNNKSFSLSDYFKAKENKDIGVHSMKSFEVRDKFSQYLELIAIELKTQLIEVIQGKKWIEISFDWQGQK